jgi:hypothetical protein
MMYYVFSYGGCGSTLLARVLSSFNQTFHLHDKKPPEWLTTGTTCVDKSIMFTKAHDVRLDMTAPKVNNSSARVIYIVRDPVEAFLSRATTPHCYHIGGDWRTLDDWSKNITEKESWPEGITDRSIKMSRLIKRMSKEKYDPMKYEEHLDSWLKSKKNFDVLFIRYEDLWNDFDKVLDFCGIDITPESTSALGQKKETLRDVPQSFVDDLSTLYEQVREKVSSIKTHVQRHD